MKNFIIKSALLSLTAAICTNPGLYAQSEMKREMRGVWIATVNNIDWPSKKGLSVEAQQKEIVDLLDLYQSLNLNTIIFQIRPAADAFYDSPNEPWSQWMSGKQGVAPEPFYDPLEFAIRESRKRGIDVHAWLNPYRAAMGDPASEDHITNTRPEMFVTYGKTKYFNPGLQQTRDYVTSIITDVVNRYDIDAVHFDDYFYPYKISGMEFPDSTAFRQFPRGFAEDRKEDWRRDNVDLIIKQISGAVKAVKPWVEFGISPFGIWKNSSEDPRGSNTIATVTNYDELYSDILKWQKEGWIDYVVPQLYWYIGYERADYAVLVDWWSKNTYGIPLYIGMAPFNLKADARQEEWRSADEIAKQLKLNQVFPEVGGAVYFSGMSIKNNLLNVNQELARHYRHIALTPENPRIAPIEPDTPFRPTIKAKRKTIELTWEKGDNVKNFVIYKFAGGEVADISNPANIFRVTSESSVSFPETAETDHKKHYYVITSQSPTNRESAPVKFER